MKKYQDSKKQEKNRSTKNNQTFKEEQKENYLDKGSLKNMFNTFSK